jgi:NAD(P)-dependent dehydrogenase (short-subunit alcohol dehydrogenase family)
MKRYENKTALVTGGGSGIGKSISSRLASEGAHVLIFDINLDSAESVASEIEEAGGNATAFACDVADHGRVAKIVSGILASTDIDVLVNNAGIAHVGNLEDTSEADLDRLLSVNVKGVYNMLAAVVPAMKKRRRGAILNMASVASTVGIADRFAYSTTKGAVLTMTYSVAKDYVDFGIRCNCVAPGRVHTPFVDNYLAENYPDNRDEVFDQLSKTQPIGRMGTADEIAALVAYLCSDEAAFVTGSNFPIDGGFVTLNN